MSKITAEHLARQAVVYVRQSTQAQVQHNHESRRRQYGLVDRARELGWAEPMVIDDDLGRSGSGVDRPGFERLLRAICEGRVGIVVSLRWRACPKPSCGEEDSDSKRYRRRCGRTSTTISERR